ncbi:hypothetical protein [Nocardioides daphniae]|uniref:DUF4245 family protein n=1 Tax=Nocardioides daphniae TaxID=402297 RepID=A0A4V1CWA9_9ACTN|nr:hypothetical protein [Nocardioides daphniae]QCC76627.1 hypothetical protein E2C04_04305 [Nocardioides daphniae]
MTGDFAGEWRSWSDEGGDHALVLDHGETQLMVYGSAPLEDLVELASMLVVADPSVTEPREMGTPVPTPSGSPTPS